MKYNDAKQNVEISIPGYVNIALDQFNHVKPKIHNINHIQHQEGRMAQMPKTWTQSIRHQYYLRSEWRKPSKSLENYYITHMVWTTRA